MRYKNETIQEIVRKYESGMDSTQLHNETGISKSTIGMWIRKYSNPRSRGPSNMIGRENFFDKIDSESKAYWLGWIMADGNVSIYNDQYSLKLHICLEDKDQIDKFLAEIDCTNSTKVKDGKNPSYYVSLTSRHMIESLIKLGVTPQKTGKESLPKIPKKLVRHFIRGYFDGDGITCATSKNKISGFVSSKELLEDILKEIDQERVIRPTKSKKVFYFQGGIGFSKVLYKYMYRNASVYMERKKQRMDFICGNTEVTLESK